MYILKSRRFIVLVLLCVLFITLLNFYLPLREGNKNYIDAKQSYSIWKNFYIPVRKSGCFSTGLDYDIEKLVNDVEKNKKNGPKNGDCVYLLDLFDSIFEVSRRYSGALDFPEKFQRRLQKGLNVTLFSKLSHQTLIHVFNRFTLESSVYNPLRSKRPVENKDQNVWSYIETLTNETRVNCDFCNYNALTAVDYLGRHETSFTVRVTNTFKLEKWHGMIITKKHHPVKFSLPEFEMFLGDVVNYAKEVQIVDSSYIYPSASWDVLYKAGASQIHPHIHVFVSPNHYFGKVEHLRRTAQNYFERTNDNYFSKLVEIYIDLGLAVHLGKAVGLCTLAGFGDMEVMILSDTPSNDLFKILYFTLRAYHELNFPCHSMSMAWSALGSSERSKLGKIPAVLRITTRGNCLSKVNDISAIDLFLTNFRDHDPWILCRILKKKISENFIS